MNSDSGILNTYSGKTGKVFTFNQNDCSRSTRIGVHVEPELVFMMGRNMHLSHNAVEESSHRGGMLTLDDASRVVLVFEV
ncbi:hypothetical protein ACFL17_00890 [Pseudomonadota bacterium]